MAAELMLINPRRRRRTRRRKARVIRARRNPRRRRRGMSALQQQYFGGRRSRRRHRRRRVIHARSNPRRHRRRRYTIMRRNPVSIGNPVGFVSSELMPAAMGAVGGLATNWIFDNYAPVSFQSGVLNPVGRLGLAALLGLGVAQVTDNRTGQLVAAGAMTITVYELLANYMSGNGLFGTPGNTGFGRIMNPRMRGLGYMNPARQMGRFVARA
jgi:hypothetical protein